MSRVRTGQDFSFGGGEWEAGSILSREGARVESRYEGRVDPSRVDEENAV